SKATLAEGRSALTRVWLPSEPGSPDCSVNLSVSPDEGETDIDDAGSAATRDPDALDCRASDGWRGRRDARPQRTDGLAHAGGAPWPRRRGAGSRQSGAGLAPKAGPGGPGAHPRARPDYVPRRPR